MLLAAAGGIVLPSTATAEPEPTPERQVLKCYDEGRILYCEPEYLQELIDQAGTTPTRIEIGNGTETLVTKTLVIPAGADIELVDTNIVSWSSSTKIIRDDGDFTGSLIRVEKGGKLTLSDGTGNGEGIIIDSRAQYDNVVTGSSFSPTIMVEGELVMNAGTITGARKMSSGGEGAVTVRGTDAKFTLNDGKITDNQRKGGQFGAANVALTKGATMVMNGGEISKGVSDDSPYAYGEAGGIGVFDGAHLTINGGTITENTGWAGNINVSHWLNESNVKPGDDTSETRSTVVFNDGEITNGKAAFAGGGISIFGNADVTMNDGTIDSNAAPNGGGVNAMDMYINGDPSTYREIDSDGSRWTKQHFGEGKPDEWTKISPARFTMNGGSITNNSATRTGGGVNVISNAVQLNAGLIEGNSAHDQGGGVYVATKSYNAHFMDTLITDNQAAAFGGGIWLCPTGSMVMHVTNGVAVFENEAIKSSSRLHWGDDIAHDNYGSVSQAGLRIDPRMLGGGEPTLYKDGSASSQGTRFDPENPGKEQIFDGEARESDGNADYRTAIQNEGLKTVVDDAAKETAKSWSRLTIQKNTAPRGAGVGSNGGLTFGTPETTKVPVTKAWKDTEGKDLSKELMVPVQVQLVGAAGGEQYPVGQPVELNADNDWTHTFTDLPKTKTVDGAQVEVQYSVQELTVDGFTSAV
ncbi:Cna B-type domain-containing protein, partial [Corynebacterium meitnerae]|nr:Cna B-type domain-containing protein [Corynebacterium meitnerae]